jgi:uncharacterized cupredoxin-like copper-binding protein
MFVGVALVSLAAACSGGSSTPAATSTAAGGSAGGSIDVALSEWKVAPSAAKAKAGEVTFNATNKGATQHELVVIKSDAAPDKLPQASGAVDEKAVTVAGRVAALDAGKSGTVKATLAAGKYVLVCNLPAHYGQGMTTAFTVE